MPVDFSGIAKWPNVPACYEWLSLDRRGDWRLQGERVMHRGLIDFMNRQYTADDEGRWFVQNGPQRVYVDLAYTPWVFHRRGGEWFSQTGEAVSRIDGILIDDEGSLLLSTAQGIGVIDDRDLAEVLSECSTDGTLALEDALAGLMDGLLDGLLDGQAQAVSWQNHPLVPIAAVNVARRFHFQPRPRP